MLECKGKAITVGSVVVIGMRKYIVVSIVSSTVVNVKPINESVVAVSVGNINEVVQQKT